MIVLEEPWNSLELSKLVLTALTPIVIAFFGWYLNRKLKKFEHRQWRNQKLVEKRLAIYDEMAPLINDLYCYFKYVGNWKECKPHEIVKLKRILDKKIYLAKALFSDDFFCDTIAFMDMCYKPFQGWGVDAKLLTDFTRRKEAWRDEWQVDWESMFTNDSKEISTEKALEHAYNKIMETFSKDIGIN